jgi:uncharacterized membrane protein
MPKHHSRRSTRAAHAIPQRREVDGPAEEFLQLIFVVHEDMEASDALRQRIDHTLGWNAVVPLAGLTYAA